MLKDITLGHKQVQKTCKDQDNHHGLHAANNTF